MNTARTIRRGITLMAIVALCVIIAVPAYAAYEDSLKGYWKMDDTSMDDNFNDGVLNSAIWSSGGSTYSETGGKAHLVLSGTSLDIRTNNYLTGDFDIKVNFSGLDWGDDTGSKHITLFGTSQDGQNQTYSLYYKSGTSYFYDRLDIKNGVASYGTRSYITDDSGELRITRVGATYHSYYRSGTDWIELAAPASSLDTAPDLQIRARIYSGTDPNISVDFDDFTVTNGEPVADAKGTNPGTIYGATQTTGKTGYGNALNFNGTSDYVKVPDSSSWNFGTGDFTLNFMVKRNGDNTASGLFSANIDGSPSWNTANGDYLVYFSDASTIYMAQWDGSAGHWVSPITDVADGVWTNISYVRSGDMLYAYKDGVMQGSGANVAGLEFDGSAIGFGRQAKNGAYFDGALDEFANWNRALDANEIGMLCLLGTDKFEWLTLGVNAVDALNLGYTTSELKLLSDLYAEQNAGALETIGSIDWKYLSGDLPGDIGGTTYDYGDTWIYDGKYYLKLGSGLEGTPIPEPGCALGLLVGFFVPGFRRLFKRKA